ncbi:MAG: class I SAM-dependent methyltransferase [Cyanobacteriota bacterium]
MQGNPDEQEPLFSIKTPALIEAYKHLGVDITSLVGTIPEFLLYRNADGLLHWHPPVTGDSNFYEMLASANDWYYARQKAEYEYASTWISKEGINLEVGCGEGHFADIYNIPNYTGLEINETAVKKAQHRGLNVLKKDFHEFACRHPQSAHRLFSFQVVEHLIDPYVYFASSHLALAEGGLLITSVPAEDSFLSLHPDDPLNCPPHHITKWTDRCLRNIPESLGFQFINLYHVPLEQVHQQWFLQTFLEHVFLKNTSSPAKNSLSKKQRLAIALFKRIKGLLLSAAQMPPGEFHIPGHTVVAVHKKI